MVSDSSNKIPPDTIDFVLNKEWLFLHQYLYRIELYLIDERDSFDSWIMARGEELSPKQYEEFCEEFYNNSEELLLLNEEFPQFLHNSFLVTTYSLLEHHLKIICKLLEEKQKISININNLQGTILERIRLFWKLTKIDFPADNGTWEALNNYSIVRNCIVHNNGTIKKDDKYLIDYANKKGLVSSSNNDLELILTRNFCEESLQTMQKFIITLYNSIK
jgi:hypothetical protein